MKKSKLLPIAAAVVFLFTTGCKNNQDTLSQTQTETSSYSITTETISEKIPSSSGSDTPVYAVAYTYPVITTVSKDNNVINKLNTELKKEAEDYVNERKTSVEVENSKKMFDLAKSAGKEFYTHSSTVNYILQYNKNNTISFLKAHEDYTGGTNRVHYSEGITFNMETGNKYALSDVFSATPPVLTNILINGFKNELSDNKELFKGKTELTEEEINNNMDKLNWYLSQEGIVFFFNPDTIIPDTNEILQFTYAYTAGNKLMFKESLVSPHIGKQDLQ